MPWTSLNDEGKTVSVLITRRQVAGSDRHARRAAPDAKAGLAALKADGHQSRHADRRQPAARQRPSPRELGIEARAELLPEDKQRIVCELQRAGT